MTSLTRLSLSALLLLAPAAAQQPPLIDRELFFGDPEIAGAQISPDGKYIAFLKPWNNTRNIWVKKTDEPFDAAKPITTDTKRPIPALLLDPRRQVHPLRERQGRRRELQCLRRRIPPKPPPPAPKSPPPATSPMSKACRAQPYDVPKSEPDIVYIGLNDRDKAWHDLYKVKHLHRRAHPDAQEHRAHHRLDLRSARTSCAWPPAPPTTATRKSCASTDKASPRSTPATSSKTADPCSSTKTASASTWKPTRARRRPDRAGRCSIPQTGKMNGRIRSR